MVTLSWTKSKEWGSEGLTHQATADSPGRKVSVVVDSPRKGQWCVRIWIDGDLNMYRETVTLKDAKQQAQDLVDALPPAEQPEPDEDVPTLPVASLTDAAQVMQAKGLTPEVLEELSPEDAAQLMAELEETFPHLAEWKAQVLGRATVEAAEVMTQLPDLSPMVPAAREAADSMQAMADAVALVQRTRQRVQFRKDTCGCPTPLHTMRCGFGGRPVVIRKTNETQRPVI